MIFRCLISWEFWAESEMVGYVSKGSAIKAEQKRKEFKQLQKDKEDLEKQAAEIARREAELRSRENQNPQI
jgi:cell shape-determining protein MreC